MQQNPWDVVIVGAGPAGLMAAITCAGKPLRILILESKPKVGAKLLMSGGGRCNITNLRVSEKNYQSGDPRIVRNILRAFPSERTVQFFKDLGVEMTLEEGTKFFPQTQSAGSVLQALLRELRSRGVTLETGRKVTRVSREQEIFRIEGEGFEYTARAVILCTGGLSYAGTGSDGSGYKLAQAMGHALVKTLPALTPLLTADPDWKKLSGITLPVRLTVETAAGRYAASEGALLFTHTGFSGPGVLDISGPWLRCPDKQKKLCVNFFPEKSEETLRGEWVRMAEVHPKWSWKRFFSCYFPERLIEVLLKKHKKDPAAQVFQCAKKDREAVLHSLSCFPLDVTGTMGYEKAEVTAGGVDLREVDPKTLGSRKHPGFYFAGEVLDVDGRIGGFNFQWAWASGFVTGKAIRRQFGVP